MGWRNQVAWGDVDGDGRFEFLFPNAMGDKGREFQCRDAAKGTLKWRLPMPDASLTFPAVADIDGDGRDECVFTMDNAVYAIGAARGSPASSPAGAVLWKLDLPGTAGPVAIADAEGNGLAWIIVACGDGHVYGIGSAESASPSRR
jgi:outer membrane protein assembly factor BamB